MKKGVRTVFFGPFVGEFGWELISWHGWVKRLCRTRYRNHHKVVCSFPGRYPLYPDADEFWPLPKKFLKNPISPRGYITDNWIKGFPKPNNKPFELPEVMPLITEVIKDFKKKLPKDAHFIVPWEFRYDHVDKKYYGVSVPADPSSDKEFKTYPIPLSNQFLEVLRPTPKGVKTLGQMMDDDRKLISIFPRHRAFRRPDKTWRRRKYEIMIKSIWQKFEFRIAVLGEPGGAFFAEGGVPKGCIDLINVDSNLRLDVQLAALNKSVLAVGGLSGAILLALLAGCPALTWGTASGWPGFKRGNYTKTKLIYYPSQDPPVKTILEYIGWILKRGKVPITNEFKRVLITSLCEHVPHFMEKSKLLAKFKKSLGVEF